MGVDEHAPLAGPALIQAAPNPFQSRLTLSFVVPSAQPYGADLFDASGRLVRRLDRTAPHAGMQHLVWDGRDQGGRTVSPGVYFLRVQGRGLRLDGRVLLLR